MSSRHPPHKSHSRRPVVAERSTPVNNARTRAALRAHEIEIPQLERKLAEKQARLKAMNALNAGLGPGGQGEKEERAELHADIKKLEARIVELQLAPLMSSIRIGGGTRRLRRSHSKTRSKKRR